VRPTEILRTKRDGGTLGRAQIDAFAQGLADGSWSDAQCGAMAMAILLRGMTRDETVALTDAMTRSGDVLDWRAEGFDRPVLDKHSTGGVGDKVSLVLAPIVAACGGLVPMVSGRGLGHTGGTLDKLEALPGYTVNPPHAQLRAALRGAGCAIVGASARVAPADRRLYAVRDVTATVESLPLITASILSKKRAAGLGALVLDVKQGNGAFMADPADARALARSLVDTAVGGGLPTVALLTDMDEVLGHSAGNALEVQESLDLLCGRPADARLRALTLELSGRLLQLGGLAASVEAGRAAAARALAGGAAAEHFARMVAALGGPADVLRAPALPRAPLQRAVAAPRSGHVAAVDVRALGEVVVGLGGGRRREADRVDPRVGLSQVAAYGQAVRAGEPLALLHAADEAAATAAEAAVRAAFTLADTPPAPRPWLHGVVAA
jgi:thymidine phosphorylase